MMNTASDGDGTQLHVLYEVSQLPLAMIATTESRVEEEEQMCTGSDKDDSTLPFELPAPAEEVPRINCTDEFLVRAEN